MHYQQLYKYCFKYFLRFLTHFPDTGADGNHLWTAVFVQHHWFLFRLRGAKHKLRQFLLWERTQFNRRAMGTDSRCFGTAVKRALVVFMRLYGRLVVIFSPVPVLFLRYQRSAQASHFPNQILICRFDFLYRQPRQDA